MFLLFFPVPILIDAHADSHLWAKSYDRDIKDVFAVESEVAQEIADSLQAKLAPAEANTVASAPKKDPAAYDLFLKGEYEERLAESSIKAESYDQAATWYRQSIARDPNFALAMARLVENTMGPSLVQQMSEAELPEVRSMAEHAVALAPNLAQAHVALGHFLSPWLSAVRTGTGGVRSSHRRDGRRNRHSSSASLGPCRRKRFHRAPENRSSLGPDPQRPRLSTNACGQ